MRVGVGNVLVARLRRAARRIRWLRRRRSGPGANARTPSATAGDDGLAEAWAWRVGADNITNNGNANYVNNVYGTPQFLTYARGQARAVTMRFRLLSRSK